MSIISRLLDCCFIFRVPLHGRKSSKSEFYVPGELRSHDDQVGVLHFDKENAVLGYGAFAVVARATWSYKSAEFGKSEQRVAVKLINLTDVEGGESMRRRILTDEVRNWSQLSSTGVVVPLLGFFTERVFIPGKPNEVEFLALIMPLYAQAMTLGEYLQQPMFTTMKQANQWLEYTGHVVLWSQMLFDLLAKMHASGYAHRDIKPENCLMVWTTLDKSPMLLLIDLTFSTPDTESRQQSGSPMYVSPEVMFCHTSNTPYNTHANDAWSAVITMYQLITNKAPWSAWSTEIYTNIAAEVSMCSFVPIATAVPEMQPNLARELQIMFKRYIVRHRKEEHPRPSCSDIVVELKALSAKITNALALKKIDLE